MTLKSRKGFNEKFLEGEDVPTCVGVAALGVPPDQKTFAMIEIDYSTIAENLREEFDKSFSEVWKEDYFSKG